MNEQQFDPNEALRRIRQSAGRLPQTQQQQTQPTHNNLPLQYDPLSQFSGVPRNPQTHEADYHYSMPSNSSYPETINNFRDPYQQGTHQPSHSTPLSQVNSQHNLQQQKCSSSSTTNILQPENYYQNYSQNSQNFVQDQQYKKTVKPQDNYIYHQGQMQQQKQYNDNPQLQNIRDKHYLLQQRSEEQSRNHKKMKNSSSGSQYTGMIVPTNQLVTNPTENYPGSRIGSHISSSLAPTARSANDKLPTPPKLYQNNQRPEVGQVEEEDEQQVNRRAIVTPSEDDQVALNKMEDVQLYLKEQHRKHLETTTQVPKLRDRMKVLESMNKQLLERYQSVLNQKQEMQKEKFDLQSRVIRLQSYFEESKSRSNQNVDEVVIKKQRDPITAAQAANKNQNLPRQMQEQQKYYNNNINNSSTLNEHTPQTERVKIQKKIGQSYQNASSTKRAFKNVQKLNKSPEQVQNQLELSGTLKTPLQLDKKEPFSPAIGTNSLRFGPKQSKQKLKLDVLARIYKQVPTLKRAVVQIDFSKQIEMALKS